LKSRIAASKQSAKFLLKASTAPLSAAKYSSIGLAMARSRSILSTAAMKYTTVSGCVATKKPR
jgi:hypothetical protein